MNPSRTVPADCNSCRLARTRTNVVAGKGLTSSTVVFVGEAPGKDEDSRGEPFVGRAGNVLDDALTRLGVSRRDVFVTNLVKCRPPKNRRPRRDEITACSSHFCAEIDVVRPKAICVLGQTVARELFGMLDPIGETLIIQGTACQVIGILESKGATALGADQDDALFMPITAVQRKLLGVSHIHRIDIVTGGREASFRATVPHLYEHLAPTDQVVPVYEMESVGGIGFVPEHYVDISAFLECKLAMLREHRSQVEWQRG